MRDSIASAVRHVFESKGRPAPSLRDADKLIEHVGLDSLDLAVIVVSLERELGIDPFSNAAPRVQTFGDLVALYESHVKGGP